MNRYCGELLIVLNNESKKRRYYKKVNDSFIRIGLKDYDQLYDQAYGIYNLTTVNTKKHTRHFTGITFYI